MKVVSNTSPISNLAIIGRLDLLRHFYQSVLAPSTVVRELVSLEHSQGAQSVKEALLEGWLREVQVTQIDLVNILKAHLDHGEAEAIAMAAEIHANLLLIDDAAGRRLATSAGLKIKGTAGVLAAAARVSLIPSLPEDLKRLRTEAGFRLSPEVEDFLLHQAATDKIKKRRT